MSTTVVLVEDDHDVRALLALSLPIYADIVIVGEAATMAEARSVLADTRPDVAVLDIGLPDGSGADLIGFPAESPPVAVILSAQVAGGHEALITRGAAAVLDKPAAPADVAAAVIRVSQSRPST